MKYGTEGERQMMEDTQRRTGERAGHHHTGRLLIWRQINWEMDRLGDTWPETHDERQEKARKRHPESQIPIDSAGDK